jgi:hypothetical protein
MEKRKVDFSRRWGGLNMESWRTGSKFSRDKTKRIV